MTRFWRLLTIFPSSSINSDQSGSRLSGAAYDIYLKLLFAAPGRQSTLDNNQLTLRVLPKPPNIARAPSTLIREAQDSRGLCLTCTLSFYFFIKSARQGRQSKLDNGQLALRVIPEPPDIARALSTLIRAAQDSRWQCVTSMWSFCPRGKAVNRSSIMVNSPSVSFLSRQTLCERSINSDQSSSSLSGAVSNMYFELLSAAPGHQSTLDNNQLTLRVLPKPPEIARASPINSDQSSSRLSVAVPNMYLELLSAAPGRQSTLDNDQLALRVLPKLPEIARVSTIHLELFSAARGRQLRLANNQIAPRVGAEPRKTARVY
ncbi:hypothetical protein FB451DRAFT_1176902 [Mycena latifolia]|nr:hypothetical protein FB451DRAFT_1176902 [Mycena latifolia]